MPEINLTTRKLTDKNGQPLLDKYGKPKKLPRIFGTFVRERDEQLETTVYRSRFSEAYCHEGHDFVKGFNVLRTAYWLKYHLLTREDISVYEDIQLFASLEMPFTTVRWAEELGINRHTLRQHLDNLINAELLEIVTTDGVGSPNYYILRTPYFERQSLDGESSAQMRRRDAIWKAGYDEPDTYLEDHIERLRRQIKRNTAGRLRSHSQKGSKLQKKHGQIYARLKDRLADQRLVWFRIANQVGMSNAANLDNAVWRLAKSDLSKLESIGWKREIRNRLKGYVKRFDLRVDDFFIDYLEALFDFYNTRVAVGK